MKKLLVLVFIAPALSFGQQWSTSGTNISNSNTGSVGIGINPTFGKLQISSGNDSNPALRLEQGSFSMNGTSNFQIDANGVFGGRFQVSSNGNVGIGNNTPNARIDATTNGGQTALNLSGNSSSWVGADINVTRTSSNAGVGNAPALQFNDPASSSYNIIQSSNGGLQFFNNYHGWNWIERMRIIDNGNVGIGTTNPWFAKLQIDGGAVANNAIRLDQGKFSMNGSSRFEIDAPGIVGGRLLVLENGNVGIGTTDPGSFKLAVNGKTWTTEVQVAVTRPPDYVFDPAYNLSPLDSIKTYIDKNKHLPEVPSAKEMEKNGVNLGEMNMLLLKKIEELTLYQIEANKKIEILQKKVETLITKK